MPEAGGGFDVVLADLGVSSMQIDNPARGFTFKAEGPLDLRLDPSSGQSASALLQSVTRRRLRELLLDNADEPYAEPLAAALQGQYLETTTELAALVRQTLQTALARGMPEADRRGRDEEGAATNASRRCASRSTTSSACSTSSWQQLPSCLKPGGRVAILSFHSGEDRRVKKAFQAGERAGIYARVAPDPVRPSAEERRANPRSSSAKLQMGGEGSVSHSYC